MAGVKLFPIYIHVFATVKSETIGFISPKASLMAKTPTGRESAISFQPETCIITLDQHINEVTRYLRHTLHGGQGSC